jgi:DNA replication protein DnaC
MTSTPQEAVIGEYLKVLKMPGINREYKAVSRQACDGGWPYEEYLKELLEREVQSRQEHTAALRLRQAHFPEIKTLDQIDWLARARHLATKDLRVVQLRIHQES